MAEELSLYASSGNAQIDEIAAGIVSVLELSFPEQISGYYFEGSCADQATTALSDIDMALVLRQPLAANEAQRFRMLRSISPSAGRWWRR